VFLRFVIGKATLLFLKTGEKKKEAFPREFHFKRNFKNQSFLESSSWGNKHNIFDRTKSTGYSKPSR